MIGVFRKKLGIRKTYGGKCEGLKRLAETTIIKRRSPVFVYIELHIVQVRRAESVEAILGWAHGLCLPSTTCNSQTAGKGCLLIHVYSVDTK